MATAVVNSGWLGVIGCGSGMPPAFGLMSNKSPPGMIRLTSMNNGSFVTSSMPRRNVLGVSRAVVPFIQGGRCSRSSSSFFCARSR
jgi:hypothetical protein